MGFFHPYTNDGGGGERVLWCAVRALHEQDPHLSCIIYTGDSDATPESLSARALRVFGVKLSSHPKVSGILKTQFCLFLFVCVREMKMRC